MSDINQLPTGETGQSSSDSEMNNGRREALERLAKYTAPAMLAMLLSTKSAYAGAATSK